MNFIKYELNIYFKFIIFFYIENKFSQNKKNFISNIFIHEIFNLTPYFLNIYILFTFFN